MTVTVWMLGFGLQVIRIFQRRNENNWGIVANRLFCQADPKPIEFYGWVILEIILLMITSLLANSHKLRKSRAGTNSKYYSSPSAVDKHSFHSSTHLVEYNHELDSIDYAKFNNAKINKTDLIGKPKEIYSVKNIIKKDKIAFNNYIESLLENRSRNESSRDNTLTNNMICNQNQDQHQHPNESIRDSVFGFISAYEY
ncbi:7686_t:CDS:2 [Ambispora leptoticha]|uniref:7686_t:CDS:1 n=1 Tax=Ambispora leptoticha TaxID=144679 RepID=A0A9N9CLU6_9GLOM|nr:7686_t:CDS:2 [Ambispora leptoticha]